MKRSDEMEGFYQGLMTELKSYASKFNIDKSRVGKLNIANSSIDKFLNSKDDLNEKTSTKSKRTKIAKIAKKDGLIYIMYTYNPKRENELVPLYIGKTELAGRVNPISVNIKSYGKFGRWGHTYAYHIGDLSYAYFKLSGNPLEYNKEAERNFNAKKQWAERIFLLEPLDLNNKIAKSPQLKFPVYFHSFLWGPDDDTLLGFNLTTAALERFLVGIASLNYPNCFLNKEFKLKKL